MPALVLVVGMESSAAVGTSLVVIAINSAVALATRVGTHAAPLDWPLLVSFTAATVAGSLLGSRLAGRVQPHRLTTAFTTMVIAIALSTGAVSLTRLL